MKNKVIIGVIVIVVIAIVALVASNNNKKSSMNMPESEMQNMPSQSTAQTSPASSSQTPTAKNAVVIQNFSFSPATLTVKVGDKVTWTNQDSVGHSATADDNSFDTGVLSQGQSGSVTFSKPGTYTYHCSVHPNMKGTIVVQ